MSQIAIARRIGVDQSTISDDVKALREASQRFIFDLAKSDLGFYYKTCIDGIEEAKAQCWTLYQALYNKITEARFTKVPTEKTMEVMLKALKVAIQADEAKFRLLSEGPNVMTIKSMEDRLHQIEQHEQQEEAAR
jgi:hypothetical protein